jgi:hypothetical protein
MFKVIRRWFSKQLTSIEKIEKRVAPMIPEAQAIVSKLSAVVDAETKALGSPAVLAKLNSVLHEAAADVVKVAAFVAENQNAPVKSVLLNAGSFILGFTPAGAAATVISDLDLAIQTAYSVLKG